MQIAQYNMTSHKLLEILSIAPVKLPDEFDAPGKSSDHSEELILGTLENITSLGATYYGNDSN